MKGKKILILGVANKKSIAWGITKALHDAGAELAFTYMNDAIEKRLTPLAAEVGAEERMFKCDVQSDEDLQSLRKSVADCWGQLDGVVHSVAFADKGDLSNRFSDTTRAGFQLALDISAYSLVAVSGALAPLMTDGGSIITLTYLGAERVVPNYNVMGVAKAALEASVRYLAHDLGADNIRVNAISAGPIKTLAASGIPEFRKMLGSVAEAAPLKRNCTQEDVGNTALYYMSDLSSAVTGETTYVDCGYSIMGM